MICYVLAKMHQYFLLFFEVIHKKYNIYLEIIMFSLKSIEKVEKLSAFEVVCLIRILNYLEGDS